MLHMIVLGLCGLLIAAALAGFFVSFWRQRPDPSDSSRSPPIL